jgi:hypothetical protein
MTATNCEVNSCFDPISQDRFLIVGIMGTIKGISQRKRINKLLSHPSGKVNNLIMPKIAIKATIGGAVAVTI